MQTAIYEVPNTFMLALCPTTGLWHCVMWTDSLTTRSDSVSITAIQTWIRGHVLKEEIVIIDPASGVVLSGR